MKILQGQALKVLKTVKSRKVQLCVPSNHLKDWYIVEMKPPHDKSIWIKIIAEIRNNKAMTIHSYPTTAIWNEEEESPQIFIWKDGNFSCDCNRHLFFQRAIGEEESDIECSEGKYSVNLRNPRTGMYFYKEFKKIYS